MRALVLALAACSSGPGPARPTPRAPDAAPPTALDRDLPRLAERSVKLYEDVAQAFATAGAACPAATARLGELAAAYRDVTEANRSVLHDGRARELKAALAPFDDRLDAAAKAIMQSATMAHCAEQPAFGKAFDDLVGAPP